MTPRPPPDLYGGNTPQENSRRIANEERFQNRVLRDREREISNIPRGIVKSRTSSLNINLHETPPPTLFNYIPHPPSTPCETRFYFLSRFHLCEIDYLILHHFLQDHLLIVLRGH